VWSPTWALLGQGAPDEPFQAVGDDRRVSAINPAATAAGIRLGMLRSEAEALCPTVVTVPRDLGAEVARFEPIVSVLEEVVPRVEIVAPGMALIPVAGAVGYYGSEPKLAKRVAAAVTAGSDQGAHFRFGIASGPFAAQRAAELATGRPPLLIVEDDVAFLQELDIAAIDREDLVATFRWLGITTLGDLARLPRSAIVSRFGTEGMTAHRLASGEDREVRPRALPEDLVVEERFDPPLDDFERASFAARALANRLVASLAGRGAHRVIVEAEAADGTVRSRTWRSADPFDDASLADRVRWQLRAWIEGAGVGVRGGLAAIRIRPADLSGTGRQMVLSEDASSTAETRRALTEVQAIVGPDALLQAVPQGGRDPGERVAWHRWDESPAPAVRDPAAPWPGRLPAPAPALVPPTPQPLAVEWDEGLPSAVRLGSRWVPVLTWAGPWRSVARWWHDGHIVVDRYQLVTSAGAFLCEVRDGTSWLVGVYD